MKSVLFVNRFYWPETPATGQLLTDLAVELSRRGWNVSVITSRAAGNRKTSGGKNHEGVDIIRISTPRWGERTVIGKAAAFFAFYIGAALQLARQARRGQTVVIMTDPPMLGAFVGWIVRAKGARIVHWLQDIYPEIAVALSGQSWLKAALPIRNAAWRSADQCVTLGEAMASVVIDAGVAPSKVTIVPNWPPARLSPTPPDDPEVVTLRRELGLEDCFVVGYSGNLGRVHELAPIIGAAALLKANRQIVFAFFGSGAQRATLEAEATRLGLTNVRFYPPQPRERLRVALAAANIHLVTLRSGCERFVFPSKLYGIVAIGRPVLFVGPTDSELARLVTESALGCAFPPNDVEQLATTIASLAADPGAIARHSAAAVTFAGQTSFALAANSWEKTLNAIDVH